MTLVASSWTLLPGDTVVRKALHQTFGGRTQGGISPSAKSPNVMLFTDPAVGRLHGYNDGWGEDGAFHYTGEGQLGDQQMVQGNRATLLHDSQGRTLRLFRGVGGSIIYLGEFETDKTTPWYSTDAIESGGEELRKVIVFRLRPVGSVVHDASDSLPNLVPAGNSLVEVESLNTEAFVINPSAEPREGARREQKLVLAYKAHLEASGCTVKRNRMRPHGEPKPLFSDVFNQTRNQLVEAKGSVTRECIRMIIGQLADYRRFVSTNDVGALLPERPRKDLEDLLSSQGIATVWRNPDGTFADNAGDKFV